MQKHASRTDENPENIVFGPLCHTYKDRRHAPRHCPRTPAYASISGSTQAAITDLNEIRNISENGMCVQFATLIQLERLLPLCLEFSETKTRIHIVGHVAWSQPSGKTGICFPEMSEASCAQLKNWLKADAKVESSSVPQDPETTESAQSRPPVSPAGVWAEFESELESYGSDLDGLLNLTAQRALKLTNASGAAIALASGRGPTEMLCRARAGPDSPGIGVRFESGSGFSGECVRSGATIICNDAEQDARVDRESCRALRIRSILATPIKKVSEIIGVIEVFSREASEFGENDVIILQRLAAILSRTVQRTDFLSSEKNLVDLSGEEVTIPQSEMFAIPSTSPARKITLVSAGIFGLIALGFVITPAIGRMRNSISNSHAASFTTADSSLEDYATLTLSDLMARANHDDVRAQYALAMRYANGMDVKQDFRQAKDWFLRAAEQGHVAAQSKIAAAFWEGKGVPQDYSKAYFWALLAEAGGDEPSRGIVMSCATHLSPIQITAEQKQADEWLHSHHIGYSSP